MAVLAFLYGFCGLASACWLVYCLSDPTAGQPSNVDALAVTVTVALWPVAVVVIVIGLFLDELWHRRRVAYYGGAK